MGRHSVSDEYEDDVNEPDESDLDDDEGDELAETVECPNCRREVYEFAEQCPRCGAYLSREDAPRSNHPRWIVITAVVLLAALVVAATLWNW